MTPRADFLAVLLRQQLRMDAERRAFAGEVMDVVRGDIARWQVPGPLLADLMTRDLEPVYDRWYGRFPGDVVARWYQVIVSECHAAKLVPIQRAVEEVARRLKAHPAVLREVLKEAA
jgi:hypothetical protein